ncbi:enoyl-CoA hydratase/isomerase family protein [Streptomyces sp. NPDC033753]|uniref:enoyl-CoA hydratase/isomerase family protein n=2 Tax=unclassified Streptomyces TaxID=2593676 RepID=UPI0033EB3D3C
MGETMATSDAPEQSPFAVSRVGDVAQVTFAGGKSTNSMSRRRMRELSRILRDLDSDDAVNSIVLYGGPERSFASGGDFNEVIEFTGGSEVDDWIDDIADLFVSCLGVNKPLVAAIDGYAIGLGLEIALTADFRIASDKAKLRMPEFPLGTACNFGGYMLERVVGRSVMQRMLMTGDFWDAATAEHDGLLHRVTPEADLEAEALAHAARFAGYNPAAFRSTKAFLNREYVNGIRQLKEEAKASHRAGFASGRPQEIMATVIGRG